MSCQHILQLSPARIVVRHWGYREREVSEIIGIDGFKKVKSEESARGEAKVQILQLGEFFQRRKSFAVKYCPVDRSLPITKNGKQG